MRRSAQRVIYEKLGVVEGSARGAVEGPSDWPHLAHELQRSNRYTEEIGIHHRRRRRRLHVTRFRTMRAAEHVAQGTDAPKYDLDTNERLKQCMSL
jgi:hypothetical protein